MEGTPKLKKRNALSLGRLNHKRLSSEQSASVEVQRSPSVVSLCSDGGIECTPPRKKFSLDDSIDYSPKTFDDSYSPSGLLSQSLVVDSPEVGWRWCRRNAPSEISSTTPDSAYAAESSFASAGSSADTRRSRSNSTSQRPAYERRRKAAEHEMRRAEKMRADELLKQRCARLQEQLDRNREKENEKFQAKKRAALQNDVSKSNSSAGSSNTSTSTQSSNLVSAKIVNNLKSPALNANESLSDFWNDSADGFLLEATQQVESKILELTQKTEAAVIASTQKKVSPAPVSTQVVPATAAAAVSTVSNSAPVTASTKASPPKEKRSSLYMKFLEDETPDDWFLSLDEAILQATQTPKTRSSFQRCNSMPSATKAKSSVDGVEKSATTTASTLAMTMKTASIKSNGLDSSSINRNRTTGATTAAAAAGSAARMKRHCSSTALSPASSNSSHRGGRQLHFRK